MDGVVLAVLELAVAVGSCIRTAGTVIAAAVAITYFRHLPLEWLHLPVSRRSFETVRVRMN